VSKNKIYLSPPHMGDKEIDYMIEAFRSNWVAPLGPAVDAFEDEMAKYIGVKSACALSSGTAGLHLALRIAGVKPGDVVLCPSLTFAASANVILYERALPVFIDVNPNSWTIETNLIEKQIIKYSPKAIIAVDLYGQSCDYEKISFLCEKYNVTLIEDAAESLGSEYMKKKCGSFGHMAILSFNGNKIITTSGGGMLLSDNEDYIAKAHFLSSQAREDERHYEHKELGYNYRLSNILAALGRGQLASLDHKVKVRRKIFKHYKSRLGSIEGINFMPELSDSKSNRWLTTLTLDKKIIKIDPLELIKTLEKENIEARQIWKPMHLQPLYKDHRYIYLKDKDISGELFTSGLCLPSGSQLTIDEQNLIIDIIIDKLSFTT